MAIIKWLAILSGLLTVTFFAVNWHDEDLKPEVQAALNWQPPANMLEDNGFLILLGMDAPLDQDAYQFGKQKYEAEFARFNIAQSAHQEPPAKEFTEPNTFINWKDEQCDYQAVANCVDYYLNVDRAKFAEIIVKLKTQLARYKAIQQSKYYVEANMPMLSAEVPSFSSLMSASEVQRIQAIWAIADKQTQQGMAQLIENAMFSRRLLKESNSLISHMVALKMLRRDMLIISELLARDPALAKTYQAQIAPVLASIDNPEYGIKNAFIAERNMVLATYNFTNVYFEDVTGSAKWRYVIARFGYLPKATINLFFQWSELRLLLANVSAHELNAAKLMVENKQKSLLGIGFGWFYFKNPAGKILMSVAEPNYVNYIERHHDTEGFIRIVRAQLQLLAENTPKENIAKVLAQHPNPYTLQPFKTKGDKLVFEGQADYSYDDPAVFEVNIAENLQ